MRTKIFLLALCSVYGFLSICEANCDYTTAVNITSTEEEFTAVSGQESVLLSVTVNRAQPDVMVTVSEHDEQGGLDGQAWTPDSTCCICDFHIPVSVTDKKPGLYKYVFTATETLSLGSGHATTDVTVRVKDKENVPIGQEIIGILVLLFVVLVAGISFLFICCWKKRYDDEIEKQEYENRIRLEEQLRAGNYKKYSIPA